MPGTPSTPAGKRRSAARAGRAAPQGRKPAQRRSGREPAKGRATARRPAKPKAATTRKPAKPKARTKAAAAGRRSRPPARRAAQGQASKRRRGLRVRRPSLRTTLIVVPVLLAALAAGYYGWLRDSSLLAVTKVQVNGITGPEAPQVIEALTSSGRSMTTLHVRADRLEAAVKGFPTVASVSADPDLLHGLVIEVDERPPALIAEAKGESVPVAGDGTLLRGVELGDARDQLPVIDLSELPPTGKLEGEALAKALVLGAAPKPIRPLIDGVSVDGEDGVGVMLRGEIPVRFGTHQRAASKWAAATAVLADSKLDTLTYIDVRVPERPAVGGAGEPIAPEAAAALGEPAL